MEIKVGSLWTNKHVLIVCQRPFKILYSPLQKNIECDVCIIGAGIAGLTSVICSQQGKKVLFWRWPYCDGETSYIRPFNKYSG